MAESAENRATGGVIEVTSRDLPLSCPNRNVDAAAVHPRVYIPLKEGGGQVVCPYCGTEYRLVE